MEMAKSKNVKKKYTKKEKISILEEAKKNGVKVTLEKYDLYPATYYYWKRKYVEMGAEGLDHGITKERLALIRKLERENAMLKQLLAEKQLEEKLKNELLKKKYPHLRKLL